jgi:hypothetical protein
MSSQSLGSLVHKVCSGTRAFQFCARIFELYMGDLFDPVNIGVIQRLF